MTEKNLFAIFSPILGEKLDYPSILLDKTIQVDNGNIYRKYGEVHRRLMRLADMLNSGGTKSQTPDANPILHYHTFIKRSTAMQYFLAFTKKNIYCWNVANKVWDLKFTCQSNCTEWDTITYNDKIIATNNIDMVLVWDTTGYFMPLQNTTPTNITAVTGGATINRTDIAFVDGGVGEDTITTVAGNFVTAGFAAGNSIKITGSASNNGTYTIVSVVALTINVATGLLTAEAAGASVTIENGNPCQVTAATHGLTTGDRVFIKNCGGMVQINNLQFVVTVIDVNKFTLNGINSSTYTTYTSGGTVIEFQGIEYSAGLYLTKAKYVTTFENYLLLGWTTENGVMYPQRERWNCIANETDWKSAGSGAKETEGHDRIVGFKIYDGVLIIFKEKKRIAQTLVPTTAIWNWSVLPGNIGCMSNHSIVEDADGRVYWLADDLSIREMQVGEISKDIDPIVKLIEPSMAYLTYGIYIEETGEIWWSIPYDNALPNKVITVKGLSNWGELDLAVSCFGSYKEA